MFPVIQIAAMEVDYAVRRRNIRHNQLRESAKCWPRLGVRTVIELTTQNPPIGLMPNPLESRAVRSVAFSPVRSQCNCRQLAACRRPDESECPHEENEC